MKIPHPIEECGIFWVVVGTDPYAQGKGGYSNSISAYLQNSSMASMTSS